MQLTQEQAKEIANQIAPFLVPFEDRIFNAEEAAQYFRVSTTYFLKEIRTRPGFPQQLHLGGRIYRGKPKYFARDLKTWAENNALNTESM